MPSRYHDPCEWAPKWRRYRRVDEKGHAAAEWVLGRRNSPDSPEYRVCTACALLPEFIHFRVLSTIERKD